MEKIKVIDQDTNQSYEFFDNSDHCVMNKFEGFEYPDVKGVVVDVPGKKGAVYITSSFGRRVFSWAGEFLGTNFLGERRLALAPMTQNGRMKLIQFTTYDGLELQCEADITKVVTPYNHTIQAFLVEAVAPDFRFSSQELHTLSMGESQITGGTPIPTPVPIDLSGSQSGSTTVTNSGSDLTPVKFKIDGPGTGFTVRNHNIQKQFRINYTLSASDSVVIDTTNRTVILNGITSIYSAIEGFFWALIPGDNEILFVADSGSTSATKLTMEWRDAYNGV